MRRSRNIDPEIEERWGRYIIQFQDRDRILEVVKQHPGANQRFIKDKVQICWDVLRHHLKYLKSRGKVSVVKPDKRTERYFVPGPDIKLGQIWGIYWQPHYPELIQMIDEIVEENYYPRRSDILDLAESKGWARSTTGYRLAKLVKAGLVKKEKILAYDRSELIYTLTNRCFDALSEMELMFQSSEDDRRRIVRHENIRKGVLSERRERKRKLRALRDQMNHK